MATEHVKIDERVPFEESIANGSQTIFAFDFVIFQVADLNVYVNGALQSAGFSVVPDTAWPGKGAVVFDIAPASGTVVARERAAAIQRVTDFSDPGDFRADTLNDQLDYLTILLQDVDLAGQRALRTPPGEAPGLELPGAATRQNSVLAFDQAGLAVSVPHPALGAELFKREFFTTTSPNTNITLAHTPDSDEVVSVFVEDSVQTGWGRNGTLVNLAGTPAGLQGYVEYYHRYPFMPPYRNGQSDKIVITDFGAVADSTGDQTSIFVDAVNAISAYGEIALPEGNYVADKATIQTAVGSKLIYWTGPGTINGSATKDLPGLNLNWFNRRLTARAGSGSTGPNDFANFEFHRLADYTGDNGATGKSETLRAYTRVYDTAGTPSNLTSEWVISGVMDNYSDAVNGVAVSGVANTYASAAGGPIWGLHAIGQDWGIDTTGTTPGSSPTQVTGRGVWGAEIGAVGNGLDDNYNRIGIYVVSHNLSNKGGVYDGTDVIGIGINVITGRADYNIGLKVHDTSGIGSKYREKLIDLVQNNGTADGISIGGNGTYGHGIRMTAVSSTADILLSGNSPYGLILNGNYTNAALRIGDNEKIGWRANNTITSWFETATGRIRFDAGLTERIGIEVDPTPRLFLNGTPVVRERITGWSAPTGTATRTAFDPSTVTLAQLGERVHALIDDLTTHGLIGA